MLVSYFMVTSFFRYPSEDDGDNFWFYHSIRKLENRIY